MAYIAEKKWGGNVLIINIVILKKEYQSQQHMILDVQNVLKKRMKVYCKKKLDYT